MIFHPITILKHNLWLIATSIILTTSSLPAYQEKRGLINLHFKCPDPGGVESHLLGLNKIFTQHGINNTVLTSKYSDWLVNIMKQEGNPYGKPCATYQHNDFDPRAQDIIQTVNDHSASIVVCCWPGNLPPSIKAQEALPLKLIYMHHNFSIDLSAENLKNFNKTEGMICVSPMLTEQLKQAQQSDRLTVKQITHIAPFWDQDKFLTFKPTRSKEQFFKDAFNIAIHDNAPIICSVANLYWYKNHQVLIRALGILKREKQTHFHLVLAGDGPEKDSLTKLAQELNLTEQIHFLGKTTQTPELLYHSDLHVLASKGESFGLVHLEAATMKKPFIGATGTGAEGFIQNGISGFIFENNNAQDLAIKLGFLLEHPDRAKAMGKKAFDYVQQHYAPEILFNQWMEFLEKI